MSSTTTLGPPAGAREQLRQLLESAAARPSLASMIRTDLAAAPKKPAWRHLAWIPATPLFAVAGVLLLPEVMVCGLGIVLSLLAFEWAKLTFRVLPAEFSRRALSTLVPAFGCYWKIEAFKNPVLRLMDDQDLIDYIETGRSGPLGMAARLLFGLPMLFVLTVLKLVEQVWASTLELWPAQIRQVFGLLAARLVGPPFRPFDLYLRLAMPFGIGELTAVVFEDEAMNEVDFTG